MNRGDLGKLKASRAWAGFSGRAKKNARVHQTMEKPTGPIFRGKGEYCFDNR